MDNVVEVKQIASDPEKNLNKISKDDKKKIDKVYADTMEWLERNKDSTDLISLEAQIKLTESEVKPILDKISIDPTVSNSNLTTGSFSHRSKETAKV